MTAKGPPCTVDASGRYLFRRTATADEVHLKSLKKSLQQKSKKGRLWQTPRTLNGTYVFL